MTYGNLDLADRVPGDAAPPPGRRDLIAPIEIVLAFDWLQGDIVLSEIVRSLAINAQIDGPGTARYMYAVVADIHTLAAAA